jgi:hypothetical protein
MRVRRNTSARYGAPAVLAACGAPRSQLRYAVKDDAGRMIAAEIAFQCTDTILEFCRVLRRIGLRSLASAVVFMPHGSKTSHAAADRCHVGVRGQRVVGFKFIDVRTRQTPYGV